MPKNIIICCDGTGNQFGDSNSNVVKLYSVIKKIPEKQIAYYDPGVGTYKYPGLGLSINSSLNRIFGLITGFGLYQNVYEAYSYLMENYESGDRIFLFGFSRGAYTVRVLSGFIRLMGLLEKGCQNLIPYAFQIYAKRNPNFKIANKFKMQYCRECPIKFMGIWDTVSSVGYFGNWKSYPYTANNKNVEVIRHAVAIDERRAFYKQNKLGAKYNNIKEVWFAGVHSDVGGSYPEKQSELSKISLQWILNEAAKENLIIDTDKYRQVVLGKHPKLVKPNPFGVLNKSLKGFWYLGEIIPKAEIDYSKKTKKWYIPLGRYRTIPEDSFIHETVFERIKYCKEKYSPPNIPKSYQIEKTIDMIAK
ncbi:DUF2235 domain-containing protein [Marinigracilibium pacificum]|uniref:DUF2235 domain-containing protein n=1 Tax=Marinigracilibium pacificum TaxID=2729599 RepID=A0A848IX08_9BACT|nr:DUF2235 domain-containing protein [Marinigracilibium pacificum]NMM47815.1 DUF2235 domain-containing protein [Marinigracilibium pacificum]